MRTHTNTAFPNCVFFFNLRQKVQLFIFFFSKIFSLRNYAHFSLQFSTQKEALHLFEKQEKESHAMTGVINAW